MNPRRSLRKTNRVEREWAISEDGFIHVSDDFKYKSRIVKRMVKDENGNTREIEEKVVVYWSRRFEEHSVRENRRFLDFLKRLEESPSNFRITALQSKALRKFMKKEYVNTGTGEIVDSTKIKGFVDFDKVAEYRKGWGITRLYLPNSHWMPGRLLINTTG